MFNIVDKENLLQKDEPLISMFKNITFSRLCMPVLTWTLVHEAVFLFQYLVDCVAGFGTECDIMSYAQAVVCRARAYVDSGACPLLYLHNLLKVSGQAGVIDTKKTRFARSIEGGLVFKHLEIKEQQNSLAKSELWF